MSARAWDGVGRAWGWLRQVSGDAAYDNYLRHASLAAQNAEGSGAAPASVLSRAEFYTDSLRRKYSTVSRCC
jgi:uncharacterized short protein YbdD (DUF466 family)